MSDPCDTAEALIAHGTVLHVVAVRGRSRFYLGFLVSASRTEVAPMPEGPERVAAENLLRNALRHHAEGFTILLSDRQPSHVIDTRVDMEEDSE